MKKFFSFLLFAVILIGSCKKEESIDFTLYLNYNASIFECKTFKIAIDNDQKLNEQICSANLIPYSRELKFQIEAGVHSLTAEASGINSVFQITVKFDKDNRFGYLDYNQNTSDFDFILSSSGGID